MKKILYVVVSILVLFSSCSDFLEEENKGGITSDAFYATEAGFETLVTASYNSLRTIYGGFPWLWVSGTDMYHIGRKDDQREIQNYKDLNADNGVVKTFYTDCYNGIQYANTGIYYAEKGVAMNASTLKQRLAELKFIRAFYHFLLIEQFGGIVINDKITDSPRTKLDRSTLVQSYDFVISELEAIKGELPLVSNPKGRVDQLTVKHYLAKAYLTRAYDLGAQSDYTLAKNLAEEVIGSKTISIPFEQLWSPTNQTNDEVIFAVQYDLKSMPNLDNSGNKQQSLFGPYLRGVEGGHKYAETVFMPSYRLHSLFVEDDARYNATFMLAIYQKYFDYYDKTSAQLLTTPISYYYPRKWDGDVTADEIANWRAEDPANRTSTVVFPVPYNEANWMDQIQKDGSHPSIKKFDDPSNKRWSTMCSSRDIVLARLAETYFIAAEAYLGLNQPDMAAAKINAVRNRPGNSKSGVGLPTISAADMSLDRLLGESAIEFAGEYLRWPELRRTKKLKEYCLLYNPDVRVIGASAFVGVDGKEKVYRPIPSDAISLNQGNMPQNDGYGIPQ